MNSHTALDAHNQIRTTEGKPPLKWCQECANAAQEWADKLAQNGTLTHGNLGHGSNHPKGQNLAMGGKNFDITKAVQCWYQEKSKYENQGPENGGCGHYTQLVWKDTTHVGIGVSQIGNKRIVVANYHPPGNWSGQYRRNV